ncbi:YbhB/YbcL family Raf kinase inhibitor-like protein [Thioalkalivibrio halophilus]|uniref:Phospholipid-binding protein n=1 Tax=Thioalkalivibrio halophilus TaxID=252474 RepID=A0A1V3A027_9GAMM|nr:YbhB/YbcL family Raf kinase inhibitor-like protein [Thioalkalivibrio halophilus]OOC10679.1 phospholipid-binding protein [Thioalkalivibrio halophilus]
MGFALSDMQLISPEFESRGKIPARYTGEGEDVSPSLAWSGAPEGTRGFAIICHDPDAPLVKPGAYGFVHWVLYNLPPDVTNLEAGTSLGTAGHTDFDRSGYGGPMPPGGHGVHHYFFWVLALDADLQAPPGLTLEQFLERAEPHVIGMNRLVATYTRD